MWITLSTIFLFTITQNPKVHQIDVDHTLPVVDDTLTDFVMKDNEDPQESSIQSYVDVTDPYIQDEPEDLSMKNFKDKIKDTSTKQYYDFYLSKNPKVHQIDEDYTLRDYEIKDNEYLQESSIQRYIKVIDPDIQDEPQALSMKSELPKLDLKQTPVKGILSKKKDHTFPSKTVKIHSPIMDIKQPSLKFTKRKKKKGKMKPFEESPLFSTWRNNYERKNYEKRRNKKINESRVKLFGRIGYIQNMHYINYKKIIQKSRYIREMEICESMHRHWNSISIIYKIWSNQHSRMSHEFKEKEKDEYEKYNEEIESIKAQILPLTRKKLDSDLKNAANLIFILKNSFVKDWGIPNVCSIQEKLFFEKYSEKDIMRDITFEVTEKLMMEYEIPDIKEIMALRGILKKHMYKRYRMMIDDEFEDFNLVLKAMLEKIQELLEFENLANNFDLNIYCGESLYTKEKADVCRKYMKCFTFLTLRDMKYIFPSILLRSTTE